LQVQIEAFGEEITGDMWYDILDNFVIHVQWGHEVKAFIHISYASVS
jgi:hypothetical protein